MKKLFILTLILVTLTSCIERRLESSIIGDQIINSISGKTPIIATGKDQSTEEIFSGLISKTQLKQDETSNISNARGLITAGIDHRTTSIDKTSTSFVRNDEAMSAFYIENKEFTQSEVNVYLASKDKNSNYTYKLSIPYTGSATQRSDTDKEKYDGYFLYNNNTNTEYFAADYIFNLVDKNKIGFGSLRASLYVNNKNNYHFDEIGRKLRDDDDDFKLTVKTTRDTYENYDYTEVQKYIGLKYEGNSFYMATKGSNKVKAKIEKNLKDNLASNDENEERYTSGTAKLSFNVALEDSSVDFTEGKIELSAEKINLLIKNIKLSKDSNGPFVYGDIFEDQEDDDYEYTRGSTHTVGGEFLAYFLTGSDGYYLPSMIGIWTFTRASCFDLDAATLTTNFGASCKDELEIEDELARYDAYIGLFVASPTNHAYSELETAEVKITDKLEDDEVDFAKYFSKAVSSESDKFLSSVYTAPTSDVPDELETNRVLDGAKGISNVVYYSNNVLANASNTDIVLGQVIKKYKDTTVNQTSLFSYFKTEKDTYATITPSRNNFVNFDAFVDNNNIINKTDRSEASKSGITLPEPIYRKEKDYSEGVILYRTNLYSEVFSASYYFDTKDTSAGIVLAALEVSNLSFDENNRGDDYSDKIKYEFDPTNSLSKSLKYIKYTGGINIYATKAKTTGDDNREIYKKMSSGEINLYLSEDPAATPSITTGTSELDYDGEITFKLHQNDTKKRFIISDLAIDNADPLSKKLTATVKTEDQTPGTGDLLSYFIQNKNGFYRPENIGIFHLQRVPTLGAEDAYGGYESFVGNYAASPEGEYGD